MTCLLCAYFLLDTDGNMHLDRDEVEALFQKEVTSIFVAFKEKNSTLKIPTQQNYCCHGDQEGWLSFNVFLPSLPPQLDKLYDPNAPEDDMAERFEEMNRMREHVMKEVDKDGDGLINLKEFLDSTKQEEFDNGDGWEVSNAVSF